MGILRWIAIALLAGAGALALLFLGARFADGPLAIVPGGPLQRGELVTSSEIDWSFARDEREIELQLVEPARSRTVWLVVSEGRAYVPCSLDFPPFKTWHRHALADGRAVVRVQGRRYERQLVRLTDETRIAALLPLVTAKYGRGPLDPARVWLFRLDPRP